MDIAEAVTHDYLEFEADTTVSKLMGAFRESRDSAAVIVGDDGIDGVVTREQLLASRQDPDEKARTLMRDDVPRVDRRDDIREVSRLMVESNLNLVPVYDGDQFDGVATSTSVARSVEEFLDAIDVNDVYTRDLLSVEPDTTLGQIINTLRENRISRVPVIDDGGDAVGMISYYDLMDFVVREGSQQQGGSPDGFDGHGGAGSHQGYRTTGGFGDRAGSEARLLDLPARDLMNSPVSTTGPETPLGEAVHGMLDDEHSSLLVEIPSEGPDGIVTLTDVLRSLTWEPEEESRLQVFGAEHLADLTREDIDDMIGDVDRKYEEMDLIEAYVILHQHRERLRGMPLIQATIRLFTDRGRFAGTGEEYGAAAAVRAAKDRLERNVLDDKGAALQERDRQNSDEELERVLGWWLEA